MIDQPPVQCCNLTLAHSLYHDDCKRRKTHPTAPAVLPDPLRPATDTRQRAAAFGIGVQLNQREPEVVVAESVRRQPLLRIMRYDDPVLIPGGREGARGRGGGRGGIPSPRRQCSAPVFLAALAWTHAQRLTQLSPGR